MIRQLAHVGLLLAVSSATPAVAQDNFPSWNPRAKFAWALQHFGEYCPVATSRRVTFEQLPPWMQAALVVASKGDVIQAIKDKCSQIQTVAAQY